MSSAQSAARERHDHRDRQSYEHDAKHVYDHFIINRGRVCSRCFRQRMRPVVALVPVKHEDNEATKYQAIDDPGTADETVECQTFETTENVNVCHPPRVSDVFDHFADDVYIPPAWKRACPPEKTYCECGAIDDDGTRAPLSKKEAFKHAYRLSERLEEADIAHSTERLKKAVVTMKKVTWLAGKDDTIFAHAVRQAVEQQRYGRYRSIERTDDGEIAIVGDD
jgi:G3E family GTPase